MMGILGIGKTILDKVVSDKSQRDEFTLKLLQLEQEGAFKPEELRYQAITTEGASADKWTSRARPSFLYVIYFVILMAFPMGILHACNPLLSANITEGVQIWLNAVPMALWELFGAGYLGYTASRSFDKRTTVNK